MANNEISRTEMEIFALGFTAKKQLIDAGIDSKYVDALASSEVWNGEESEALNAFITAYQAAKAANDTEVTEKLAQALENVKAARDIVLNSGDGVLNDIAALEAKIQQNYDEWKLEAIAVEARLKLKRDQISTDFGVLDDYTNSYAAAHTNALLNDGSYKLLVTMPTEYTLGNLQDELDPSFNGTAVSGETFGWLSLPAGVETLEAAKEHYKIEGNQIILEQNFDYMKAAIAAAQNKEFNPESFSFGPYNELGLPAPDDHPEVLASWHWKLKADQKFKVGTIVGVSSTMDTIYGTINEGNKIYTEGTAAVAGDDWKMHVNGLDFSSTQNPFHLLPTDMDYVNATLIYGNEGVKKIFFREDVPGVVDTSKNAKMGIKIFQNWMEQKGFIVDQTAEAYDSEKHDITPYGSISVKFNANADVDQVMFGTSRTHIIDVMFGWNMDKMREKNNTLLTLLNNLIWSSFQLHYDYQLAEFDQTPGTDGFPVMRLRQSSGAQSNMTLAEAKYQDSANAYYAGDTNTVISAFDELGFHWDTLKDVGSFELMGPQLMHMFDYTIYVSHLNNLFNNHYACNLMPVKTTYQKIELESWGNTLLHYDLAEYDKSVAGDYKIHVPRVEGIGGMTAQAFEDFAVEDEVYCKMMDYNGRGMSPLYGYNTSNTVVRDEEAGVVKIPLYSFSYTYTYTRFGERWVKSSRNGAVTSQSNEYTLPIVHFDKSTVTLEKLSNFKTLLDDGDIINYYETSNAGFNKFYFQKTTNPDIQSLVNALDIAGLKLELTWFEAVNNNPPEYIRPFFAGTNFNNTGNINGGDGWRSLNDGEIVDESNALDYTGISMTSYSCQFPYWYGSHYADASPWGATMYHLASDFVPTYSPGFKWGAFTNETIFYGNFATQNGQTTSLGTMDLAKNLQWDPEIAGKLLPTIAPEDRYYTYNGNFWQIPGIYELDSEGNYTSLDVFSDEFLNRTHIGIDLYNTSNAVVSVEQTPEEFLTWLGHHHANQSITLQKIAKNSDGKVFNQMVTHPNYWIKDGDSFTPSLFPTELLNGMLIKGALTYSGGNNPLYYMTQGYPHNFFKQHPISNADSNEKRDKVEITVNFPDFMGIPGVSYTKPVDSGLFTTGFATNSGMMWDDTMLPVFEYYHKLVRKLIGKKDPVTGNIIKKDPTDVYAHRSKVLTEGKNWSDYIFKDILDGTWDFSMTEELSWFDPKMNDLMRNHSEHAQSSVYWNYKYYTNLYVFSKFLTMDADYTLNSDGSIIIDVTKPVLFDIARAGQDDSSTYGLESPYYLEIIDINETSIGEGDNMTFVHDWDISVYSGHAYNVANDLPILTSDSRWDDNSIFDTASAGENAITEPGGDGHYIKRVNNVTSNLAIGTNAILWGDIDIDGDSIGNLIDNFPADAREILDADKDGVGNYQDQFPFSPTAHWSVLEDKDGNQYAAPGNLGNRGWGANEVKVLELPAFIEDEFNNTGLITVDQHDITGTHILKYVSSQPTEPADMPKLNLNHVTDVKMIHSIEAAGDIFSNSYHIVGELTGYYVNPNDSSQALGEYSYTDIGIMSDYLDAFVNGTATFEHAEAYIEAKSNQNSQIVNVRLGDGWGDGTVQYNTIVSLVNTDNGEIVQTHTRDNTDGVGYDMWNDSNQYITNPDGTTTKLFNSSGKEGKVIFQNVELPSGNYAIRMTGDSYSNSEGGIAITVGTLGSNESFLTGYGISINSQGALTRLVETDYAFTIT